MFVVCSIIWKKKKLLKLKTTNLPLWIVEIRRHGDNGFGNVRPYKGFGNFFHFSQNHRGYFFRIESFIFILIFHANFGFSFFIYHLERPMFHVLLNNRIIETPSYQSLRVINSISGIHCDLAFRWIADQSFHIGECHVTGCYAISLLVRYYIDCTWKDTICIQFQIKCNVFWVFVSGSKDFSSASIYRTSFIIIAYGIICN